LVVCRFPISPGRRGGCSSAAAALFGTVTSPGELPLGLMIVEIEIVSISVEDCVTVVTTSVMEKYMTSLGFCVKFIFGMKMFFVSRKWEREEQKK
jgi:hypothetical protein